VSLRSYEQTADATLSIAFANHANETHFPIRIEMEGAANLDGRLLVTIGNRNRFRTSLGTRYEIITAEGGVSGRFANYNVEAIPGGYWKVDYSPQSVALEVVRALEGDYNDNLFVEQGDLDLVLLNWGKDAATPPQGWYSDLPSGSIDQGELDRVLLNWGDVLLDPARPIVGSAVPEPRTLVIVATWLLTIPCCGRWSARRRSATNSPQ
jgi:hypothetical protein